MKPPAVLRNWILMTLAICATVSTARAGVDFPGPEPGPARAIVDHGKATLENGVVSMTWKFDKDQLAPETLTNKLTGERFPQAGAQLFRLATKEPVRLPDAAEHRVGISLGAETVTVYASKGKGTPLPLATFPRRKFPGSPAWIRIGKLDLRAEPVDHGDPGAVGTCQVSNLDVTADGPAVPASTLAEGWTIRKSARAGTAVNIGDNRFRITATANSAAAVERAIPAGAADFFCDIDKGTDAGLSWGPAMALIWRDGRFVLIGLREGKAAVFNVTTAEGEQILAARASPCPSFDLISGKDLKLSTTVIANPVKPDPQGIRLVDRLGGRAIEASFIQPGTGLQVLWRAELRDGSNYVRQTFTLRAAGKTVPLYGAELVEAHVPRVATIGLCPGSPAAARGFFFGIEMPGANNRILPTGVRIAVECKLHVAEKQSYAFSTVTGVCPEGQLRRGFLFYMERERARRSRPVPALQLLVRSGFSVGEKAMLDVVAQFDAELVKKRGVAVKSYLVDDGWDDPGKGLWIENAEKFPNGFRGMKAKMEKFASHLGIWISPLGGYGGADERTAHAREMGLVPEKGGLDLSQPAYESWFQNRCLQLMREGGVNCFKWDRAGEGVSPHFMALLDIARNLRRENPDVFINVTVGTWPSPFWLNHIDTTWRNGSGDVGWAGVGDDREKWLTFRDGYCYRLFVVQAPLYPLNSVMHHGIVHGRCFQGEKVGKSGRPISRTTPVPTSATAPCCRNCTSRHR